MTPVKTLLAKLKCVKTNSSGWSACCPAHSDRKASLSVSEAEDGTVLIRCHAGCKPPAIVEAIGLKMADLFPSKADSTMKSKTKQKEKSFPSANAAVKALERHLGKRSCLWTYLDKNRKPVGLVIRWNLPERKKEIRPVALDDDGWRIAAMATPRPLYRLPELKNAKKVLVGEGEPVADAAHALGFVATTSSGGAAAARMTDWRPLAGLEVWILVDNDEPGRAYGRAVAETLTDLDPKTVVKIIALPGLPEGGDLVNWVDAHGDAAEPAGMRAEIEDMAANSARVEPMMDECRRQSAREVIIGKDEYRVNDEVAASLGQQSDIYQRGGLLVRILEHRGDEVLKSRIRRDDGEPIVREVTPANLRENLTRCVEFFRQTDDGTVSIHPPGWCVRAVHERGEWPCVPRLEAVVTHPVLLPDGSILTSNGYDANSGLLVRIPPGLNIEVPVSPSAADVADAAAVLCDVIADFPFETPAHQASWIASLLTPLAWFAFGGPAPMFLIDANTRGAGKGLLADAASLILTGRRFSVMSYTNDREELRKRITTLAVEGDRLILLDNLAGAVGNDILDAALTSDRWKDRLLGGNRRYDGPLHVTWFATGNNVQLHADTSRRVCHIRMESTDERPELRSGFRHINLRKHILTHRGELLSAALTIARGWVVAGRPAHNLTAWGSFEGWSAMVREAVVFAGFPDPGETREQLQSLADRDAASMATIITCLPALDPEGRGVTAAEIIRRIKEDDHQPDWIEDLRGAVEELCGRLDARSLGYKFRHFKRRNFGGWFLEAAGGRNANKWVVCRVSGKADHATHVPHPRS